MAHPDHDGPSECGYFGKERTSRTVIRGTGTALRRTGYSIRSWHSRIVCAAQTPTAFGGEAPATDWYTGHTGQVPLGGSRSGLRRVKPARGNGHICNRE